MNITQMISWKVNFGKINKFIIFILICSCFFVNQIKAKDNKILLKVNNQIITTIDILNEIEYLSIINDKFKKSEKKIQIDIARNSLLKEKIKIIELLKYRKNLKIEEKLLEEIIIKYFSSFNINSLKDFEFFFNKQKINANLVIQKITVETLWNQLIYAKFYKNVKIDEDEIVKNISNKKTQKEYLLSEILISENNSQDAKNKLQLVRKTIKDKNFSEAALIYSVSETASKGGQLGWVRENVLNTKIKNELDLIKIGKFTNPIVIPGGLLILKIEDLREIEKNINIDSEIKNIIEKKTNDQLNRYSIIYLNKIKKNIIINEI